jgi:peptidoglycan/LPS O-acetylase OafA/YrhL
VNARKESANLDLLRATAVLFVLVAHVCVFFGVPARPLFQPNMLGLLGVLMFFVHTSLVLMFSLERQRESFGSRNLFWLFMLRRCFRVYPLSLLVVGVIVLFRIPSASLGAGSLEYVDGGALAVASNLLLAQNLTGSPSILGPLWSLPYEMQMYVFLPALFLLSTRLKSVNGLLALWVAAVAVALVQPMVGKVPDLVRYVPCFLPGIIAFRLTSKPGRRIPFLAFPAMLAVLTGAFMAAPRLETGMLVCLALGLTLPRFAELDWPWLRGASLWVAKYSYGIYLVHYFCIWVAFMRLGGLPAAAQWALFIVLVAGLPVLLYHAVEAPMVRAGNTVAGRVFGARRATQPALEVARETASP